jgi:hypothetical protein
MAVWAIGDGTGTLGKKDGAVDPHHPSLNSITTHREGDEDIKCRQKVKLSRNFGRFFGSVPLLGSEVSQETWVVDWLAQA